MYVFRYKTNKWLVATNTRNAFNELQQKGIIQCLQIDERKTGRTISDVKYTIKAAPQFISEQIASNKRATDTKTIAQKSNIRIIKKA